MHTDTHKIRDVSSEEIMNLCTGLEIYKAKPSHLILVKETANSREHGQYFICSNEKMSS